MSDFFSKFICIYHKKAVSLQREREKRTSGVAEAKDSKEMCL